MTVFPLPDLACLRRSPKWRQVKYIRGAARSTGEEIEETFLRARNKTRHTMIPCKTRASARAEAHAVSGNAYEVVRKPTTAGLYRINLVSSRECETLLPPSHSLSRPLSLDESLTDYVVPSHTVCARCVKVRGYARQ